MQKLGVKELSKELIDNYLSAIASSYGMPLVKTQATQVTQVCPVAPAPQQVPVQVPFQAPVQYQSPSPVPLAPQVPVAPAPPWLHALPSVPSHDDLLKRFEALKRR